MKNNVVNYPKKTKKTLVLLAYGYASVNVNAAPNGPKGTRF